MTEDEKKLIEELEKRLKSILVFEKEGVKRSEVIRELISDSTEEAAKKRKKLSSKKSEGKSAGGKSLLLVGILVLAYIIFGAALKNTQNPNSSLEVGLFLFGSFFVLLLIGVLMSGPKK